MAAAPLYDQGRRLSRWFSIGERWPVRDPWARQSTGGEAKFWLEPHIELAQNYGMSRRSIAVALRLIREHEDEIRTAWQAHFGR
jgi:hypothetical protein